MVLELVENAVSASATRVDLDIAETPDRVRFSVQDDGVGMDHDAMERLKDPYGTDGRKHPNRKVGLGFPFLAQAAELVGGVVEVASAPGAGTRIDVDLPANHIDLPPTGDVVGLFQAVFCFPGDYELVVRREKSTTDGDVVDYTVSRGEIREALGELDSVASRSALREYLRSLEGPASSKPLPATKGPEFPETPRAPKAPEAERAPER